MVGLKEDTTPPTPEQVQRAVKIMAAYRDRPLKEMLERCYADDLLGDICRKLPGRGVIRQPTNVRQTLSSYAKPLMVEEFKVEPDAVVEGFKQFFSAPGRVAPASFEHDLEKLRIVLKEEQKKQLELEKARQPPSTNKPGEPDSQEKLKIFLTVIGRKQIQYLKKFTSFEELLEMTGKEMKTKGIPVSDRRYIMAWREKYRRGWFFPGDPIRSVYRPREKLTRPKIMMKHRKKKMEKQRDAMVK